DDWPGIHGIFFYRRARDRRGHPVHGAVHGRGDRFRARAALGDRAPCLRGAGLWSRAAVLVADTRAGLAAPPSAAGPVDGAPQTVPGLPPLRSRGLARL